MTNDFILMDEAVRRIVTAIDGAERVGPLTERQCWLIAYYVEGCSEPAPALFAGGSWAICPDDQALRAEVEQALDRRAWQEAQREAAFDWLKTHGFDIDAQTFNGNALAREMAKDSPFIRPARQDALWTNWCYRVPWSPPEQLTESALLEYRNKPRVWLSAAVNIMAFGKSDVPKDRTTEIEVTARRIQAAIALFDGPARNGIVRLIGSPNKAGGDRSEDIPAPYFDIHRNLGHADNSISTDLERVPDSEFSAAFDGQHQRWFNVRVDGPNFASWLSLLLQSGDSAHPTANSTRRPGKSGKGPPERYDFQELQKDTEAIIAKEGPFPNWESWIKWCLEPGRVKLRPGMKPPKNKRKGDSPDPHTLKAGIKRKFLDKIPGLIRDG